MSFPQAVALKPGARQASAPGQDQLVDRLVSAIGAAHSSYAATGWHLSF
jgi:hypothetical protein